MNSSVGVSRPELLPFERFQHAHPLYRRAIDHFRAHNPVLAQSAAALFEMYGERLGPVADEILGYLEASSGPEYLVRYCRRAAELMAMQADFRADPCQETLQGKGRSVERGDYDIALLASVVFTVHRFELMEQLSAFFRYVDRPGAQVACVGVGTGYELMLARRKLSDCVLEGYDTDERARATSARLLAYFDHDSGVELAAEFPLNGASPAHAQRYDAVVACEILEHLAEPELALCTLSRVLKPRGYAFVTMAVNLAQEDHVFWYRNLEACRVQIDAAGLRREFEWIAPLTRAAIAPGVDRAKKFTAGNYVAVVRPW
jgi:SAM-dependent methyltransferase